MQTHSILVLFILVLYFVLLVAISYFTSKNNESNEGFFMANHNAPWWVVSVGMIGASVSGVSFLSVPGMVAHIGFQYMQTVVGFLLGYILIAKLLLPIYYNLKSPSIYEYLKDRFGYKAFKTGSSIFLLSKLFGTAAKVYVIVLVLQALAFDALHIPFYLSTSIIIFMIWLYTYRGGLRTIVWTDFLQTIFMVTALVLIIFTFTEKLNLGFADVCNLAANSQWSKYVELEDWTSKQYFFKQFFSGAFIALVMTGLDQDMIQKNRAIRTLGQSQRNMYWYGSAFIPLNFLFLVLGLLMLEFSTQNGIELPVRTDEYLPFFVTGNYFGFIVEVCFVVGIVSATFSSADSSLTALTTSFCTDIAEKESNVRYRKFVHIIFCLVMIGIICVFKAVNNSTLIDMIYTIVSYTYGPLLGLFTFGLFCKRATRDKFIPYIAISSPVICFILDYTFSNYLGYKFGYELLMLNGLITYSGLWIASVGLSKRK